MRQQDEPQKHAQRKKTYIQVYTLYDFIYLMFQNKQNCSMVKKLKQCFPLVERRQGLTGNGYERNFWGDGNVLYLAKHLSY